MTFPVDDMVSDSRWTHEMVHRDIALGNTYRLEVSKHSLYIASGLLAFSIGFPPSVDVATDKTILFTAWGLLSISIIGGIGNLYFWEKFYLTYRDFDFDGNEDGGKSARRVLSRYRRIMRFFQFVGIGLGAPMIAFFAGTNIT